jgi:hypothetical protein
MDQCAASSSATGNGSDLGIRREWPTPDYTEFETFRLVRPRLS